jgi:hypothetical protein
MAGVHPCSAMRASTSANDVDPRREPLVVPGPKDAPGWTVRDLANQLSKPPERLKRNIFCNAGVLANSGGIASAGLLQPAAGPGGKP